MHKPAPEPDPRDDGTPAPEPVPEREEPGEPVPIEEPDAGDPPAHPQNKQPRGEAP